MPIVIPSLHGVCSLENTLPLPLSGMGKLYTDGSCNPNPGPMGIGYHLAMRRPRATSESPVVQLGPPVDLAQVGRFMGQGTNNLAEFLALRDGLRHALRIGVTVIRTYTDSALLHKAVKGIWRLTEPTLLDELQHILDLVPAFHSFKIDLIPREENVHADFLSRELLNWESPLLTAVSSGEEGGRYGRELAPWQATAIRRLRAEHSLTTATLAATFRVSKPVIDGVVQGRTYKGSTYNGYPEYVRARPDAGGDQ